MYNCLYTVGPCGKAEVYTSTHVSPTQEEGQIELLLYAAESIEDRERPRVLGVEKKRRDQLALFKDNDSGRRGLDRASNTSRSANIAGRRAMCVQQNGEACLSSNGGVENVRFVVCRKRICFAAKVKHQFCCGTRGELREGRMQDKSMRRPFFPPKTQHWVVAAAEKDGVKWRLPEPFCSHVPSFARAWPPNTRAVVSLGVDWRQVGDSSVSRHREAATG